jgi:hypothetical protein
MGIEEVPMTYTGASVRARPAPDLLVVVDDATKQRLYAQLVDGGESTAAIYALAAGRARAVRDPQGPHLDGRHSVWWGPRCLGRFTATGRPLRAKAAKPRISQQRSDYLSN